MIVEIVIVSMANKIKQFSKSLIRAFRVLSLSSVSAGGETS